MVTNKCRTFCKKKYVPFLKKLSTTRKYKKSYYLPYRSLTVGDKNFAYDTCIKGFCNPTCSGYTYNKSQEKKWIKTRKHGFHTSYTPNQIEKYKKDGALSGCIEHYNMYIL
jgi:hypothetical protein